MKRFAGILTAGLLLQTILVGESAAQRTAHRPWLSRRPAAEIQNPAPQRVTSRRRSVARVRKTHPWGRRTTAVAVASSTKGDQIAQQAQRYHGVKYTFGGDSKSSGFDCSGLIRRIYNDLNLKRLPHTSAGLYEMGKPVRLSELRPGDLVFFKNTYKRGISHVGVYAGRNRFIHAQNERRGVTMTPLSDPYYQLHYAGARRVY